MDACAFLSCPVTPSHSGVFQIIINYKTFIMKALIFYLVFASGLGMAIAEYSTGEQEIVDHVANAYSVDQEDVTLQSPDQVLVDLGTSSLQGTATFTLLGNNKTEVNIAFPGRTLNFIIEDEIHGL